MLDTLDVEGDGDPDILFASNDRVAWLENGEAWLEHTIGDPIFAVQSIAIDDLDRDGDPDLVLAPSRITSFCGSRTTVVEASRRYRSTRSK